MFVCIIGFFMSPLLLMSLMRGSGYIGVTINALVVPIIVWNSTGSPSMVGAALMLEWIPKLFAYLHGGAWAARMSAPIAHRTVDFVRGTAMVTLYFAVHNQSWILAGICASIMQVCNAISNICFEGLAHSVGLKAHGRLMQSDLSAALIVVPLTFLFSMEILPLLGAFFHLVCIPMSRYAERNGMYSHLEESVSIPFFHGLSEIAKKPGLLQLSLSGFLLGTPIGAVFSFLPATLSAASPGWGDASFISTFAAARAIIGMLLIPKLSSVKNVDVLPIPALISSCGACLLCAGSINMGFSYAVPVTLTMLALSQSAFSIWSRQTRQSILSSEERLQFTGILISIEASSYLAGATLIALSPKVNPTAFVLLVGALLCLVTIIPLRSFMKRRASCF